MLSDTLYHTVKNRLTVTRVVRGGCILSTNQSAVFFEWTNQRAGKIPRDPNKMATKPRGAWGRVLGSSPARPRWERGWVGSRPARSAWERGRPEVTSCKPEVTSWQPEVTSWKTGSDDRPRDRIQSALLIIFIQDPLRLQRSRHRVGLPGLD